MVAFIPSRLLPCEGLFEVPLEKYPPGFQVVAAYPPSALGQKKRLEDYPERVDPNLVMQVPIAGSPSTMFIAEQFTFSGTRLTEVRVHTCDTRAQGAG